jgi:hypothetical protein
VEVEDIESEGDYMVNTPLNDCFDHIDRQLEFLQEGAPKKKLPKKRKSSANPTKNAPEAIKVKVEEKTFVDADIQVDMDELGVSFHRVFSLKPFLIHA